MWIRAVSGIRSMVSSSLINLIVGGIISILQDAQCIIIGLVDKIIIGFNLCLWRGKYIYCRNSSLYKGMI